MTTALAGSVSLMIVARNVDFKPWLSVGLAVAQACNAGFEQKRIAQARGDRSRQCFHAIAKRAQSGARRPLRGPRFHGPAQNASVLRFEFVKLRKRGAQAQPFRIAGIHAGNEGSDKPVEQLVSEFAANKRGDGFVFRRRLRAAQDFREEPPFRAGRKQRSGQKRGRGERRRHQPAAHENVTRRARIGVQKLVFQPERVDERRASGSVERKLCGPSSKRNPSFSFVAMTPPGRLPASSTRTGIPACCRR